MVDSEGGDEDSPQEIHMLLILTQQIHTQKTHTHMLIPMLKTHTQRKIHMLLTHIKERQPGGLILMNEGAEQPQLLILMPDLAQITMLNKGEPQLPLTLMQSTTHTLNKQIHSIEQRLAR